MSNLNVTFAKRKMYDLVADVDVHARLYVIEGFLEVSSPGRSEVTGITVSLQEREITIRSSSPQTLTDQEEPITPCAETSNFQDREKSSKKNR